MERIDTNDPRFDPIVSESNFTCKECGERTDLLVMSPMGMVCEQCVIEDRKIQKEQA